MGFLDSAGLARFFERLKPRLVRGMTQAAYDALPEAERGRGLYVITDAAGDGGGGSGGVRMASGSYVGDGADEGGHMVQIGFRPKFFVCTLFREPFLLRHTLYNGETAYSLPSDSCIWVEGLDTYMVALDANGTYRAMGIPISASEDGIILGNDTSRVVTINTARALMNGSGAPYVWFAIG